MNKKEKKVNKSIKKPLFLLTCGVLVASTFGLAGCNGGDIAQDGLDGKDGSTWYYGIDDPTSAIGKVGDFYFETDDCDIWSYDATRGWIIIANIKGEQGSAGTSSYTHIKYADNQPDSNSDMKDVASDWIGIYVGSSATAPTDYTQYVWYQIKGEQGEPGKDGISVYVGYDGYIWNGAQRTSFKLENSELGKSVAENTLDLYSNQYFTRDEITLTKPIALMGNYFPTIQKTGYSGTNIKNISIYASSDGTLEIGTAKVADIVNSRTNGSALTTKVTSFEVVKGINNLTVNLQIADDETIVIGGQNTTVNTYVSRGIIADDEFGLFTVCDEIANENLIDATNEINNKLIIKVEANLEVQQAVLSGYRALANASFEQYGATRSDAGASPMTFADFTLFENKHITQIDIPISYVTTKEQPSLALYVVDISSGNFKDNTMSKVVKTINLVVPESYLPEDLELSQVDPDAPDIQGYALNTWVSFKNLDLQLSENQTLAIYNPDGSDTAIGGFITNKGNTFGSGKYVTLSSNFGDVTQYGQIGMDVYENIDLSFSENIQKLQDEENYALEHIKEFQLSKILSGKKVSILGDSISTYINYSNNPEYNESLSDNSVTWYDTEISVDQTWWKGIIDRCGMELCVNNSQGAMGMLQESGSIQGYERAELLDNALGEKPDIIFVFLGANDSRNTVGSVDSINWEELIMNNGDSYTYATPNTFAEAYAIAIHKMQQKYPEADIILMEQIPQIESSGGVEEAMTKNNVIKALGQYFNLTTVDFIENGYEANSANVFDNIHPNANGMKKIIDILVDALYDKYVSNQ